MIVRSRKFWLVVLIMVILASGGVWAWREWRVSQIHRNDSFAARARITLVHAQFGYIKLRREQIGQAELWTKDVAGLYQFGLIDRSLAEADDRPDRALVPRPIPTNGYYVRFIPMDEVETFQGKTTRTKSYAYCLHPTEPGVTGKFMYLMGGSGQLRRCPAGLRPVPTTWPSDDELFQYWSIDCGG